MNYYINAVIDGDTHDDRKSNNDQTEMFTAYLSDSTHHDCIIVHASTGKELTQRLMRMLNGLNRKESSECLKKD